MPVVRTSTDFKTVRNYGEVLLMNELEANLKTWMDWAFLRIGAWTDVLIDEDEDINGGNMSILRPAQDPSFDYGKVWEARRKDWAWEDSVNYTLDNITMHNPISPITDITVNGSATTPDHINYPLGRVIFSSALEEDDIVKASYSYRNVQIYKSCDVPWWRELQYRSLNSNESGFQQTDDGFWLINGQHRVQMPAIVIQAIPRTTSRPFQIGDGSAIVRQSVLLEVLAENPYDRNQVLDILRGQFDQSLYLYSSNLVAEDSASLDIRGDLLDTTKRYPLLVDESDGYRWEHMRIVSSDITESISLNNRLHQGAVIWVCELVIDG